MPSRGPGGERDVLIEFLVQGNVVRVTAIDAASGQEATIVGPSSAPRQVLEATATRKLAFLLAKEKKERNKSAPST